MKRAPRAVRRGRKFRARPHYHDGLSVIAAYGNQCLSMAHEVMRTHRIGKSVIVCRDGFRMSVIAGPGTRCAPSPSMVERSSYGHDDPDEVSPFYRGPYHCVEVRLYGEPPEWWPLLFLFGGSGDDPARLPVPLVRYLIDLHGGFGHMEYAPGMRQRRKELADTAHLYAELMHAMPSLRVLADGDGRLGEHVLGSEPAPPEGAHRSSPRRQRL